MYLRIFKIKPHLLERMEFSEKKKKAFHLTISLVLEKRAYSTTFQARFICVRSLARAKPFAVCLPNSSCCQATTSFGQKQVVHVLLTLGTFCYVMPRPPTPSLCSTKSSLQNMGERSSSNLPEKTCKFASPHPFPLHR